MSESQNTQDTFDYTRRHNIDYTGTPGPFASREEYDAMKKEGTIPNLGNDVRDIDPQTGMPAGSSITQEAWEAAQKSEIPPNVPMYTTGPLAGTARGFYPNEEKAAYCLWRAYANILRARDQKTIDFVNKYGQSFLTREAQAVQNIQYNRGQNKGVTVIADTEAEARVARAMVEYCADLIRPQNTLDRTRKIRTVDELPSQEDILQFIGQSKPAYSMEKPVVLIVKSMNFTDDQIAQMIKTHPNQSLQNAVFLYPENEDSIKRLRSKGLEVLDNPETTMPKKVSGREWVDAKRHALQTGLNLSDLTVGFITVNPAYKNDPTLEAIMTASNRLQQVVGYAELDEKGQPFWVNTLDAIKDLAIRGEERFKEHRMERLRDNNYKLFEDGEIHEEGFFALSLLCDDKMAMKTLRLLQQYNKNVGEDQKINSIVDLYQLIEKPESTPLKKEIPLKLIETIKNPKLTADLLANTPKLISQNENFKTFIPEVNGQQQPIAITPVELKDNVLFEAALDENKGLHPKDKVVAVLSDRPDSKATYETLEEISKKGLTPLILEEFAPKDLTKIPSGTILISETGAGFPGKTKDLHFVYHQGIMKDMPTGRKIRDGNSVIDETRRERQTPDTYLAKSPYGEYKITHVENYDMRRQDNQNAHITLEFHQTGEKEPRTIVSFDLPPKFESNLSPNEKELRLVKWAAAQEQLKTYAEICDAELATRTPGTRAYEINELRKSVVENGGQVLSDQKCGTVGYKDRSELMTLLPITSGTPSKKIGLVVGDLAKSVVIAQYGEKRESIQDAIKSVHDKNGTINVLWPDEKTPILDHVEAGKVFREYAKGTKSTEKVKRFGIEKVAPCISKIAKEEKSKSKESELV